MNELGRLSESDGQYEFRDPGRKLLVRGGHPEWVLMAAAEVISNTARLEAEGLVDELSAMLEFDAAEPVEVDAARYSLQERFEIIPQCIVSLGTLDYRWAASEGRAMKPAEFGNHALKRVHDMSLTRSQSFLSNGSGVDMPGLDVSE